MAAGEVAGAPVDETARTSSGVLGAQRTPELVRAVSRQAIEQAPWFLFLWVLDPHDPYFPPDGYDRWRDPGYDGKIDGSSESIRRVRGEADVQRLIDLYDGEIAYTDAQFGLLVDELKAMGLYDDTLIVVVGDHGEAFGDHGDFVHGHLAYDEIMHVPMIMKFPSEPPSRPFSIYGAHQANGREAGALAQLTDVRSDCAGCLGAEFVCPGHAGPQPAAGALRQPFASQCGLCRNPVIRRKQSSPGRAR